MYDADYFEHGLAKGISCYTNYRWLPELTIPMCAVMISRLGIGARDVVLDFGCAKGFVVKAMRLLHRRAYGVDVSSYAVDSAPSGIGRFLRVVGPCDEVPLMTGRPYDWTLAKDVLEHVAYDDIAGTLDRLTRATRGLFVAVPLGADGRYVVPDYEVDKTHRIREPLGWWRGQFEAAGFEVVKASYRMRHIKERWSEWRKGNGFFILNSRKAG